jgi:hypothetical protein
MSIALVNSGTISFSGSGAGTIFLSFSGSYTGCIVAGIVSNDTAVPQQGVPTCNGVPMTLVTIISNSIPDYPIAGRTLTNRAFIYYLPNVGSGTNPVVVSVTGGGGRWTAYAVSGMRYSVVESESTNGASVTFSNADIKGIVVYSNIYNTGGTYSQGYYLPPAVNQTVSIYVSGCTVAASFGAMGPMGIMHFT